MDSVVIWVPRCAVSLRMLCSSSAMLWRCSGFIGVQRALAGGSGRHLDPGLLLRNVLAHALQLPRDAGALLRDDVGARQLLHQLRLQRRLRLPVPLLLCQAWPPLSNGMGPKQGCTQTRLMPQNMTVTHTGLSAHQHTHPSKRGPALSSLQDISNSKYEAVTGVRGGNGSIQQVNCCAQRGLCGGEY